MLAKTARLIQPTAVVVLAALVCTAGYRYSKGRIEADIYRTRLAELNTRYHDLRGRYNEVVKKTAVTELVVRDGKIDVVFRTADGVLKAVPTGLSPAEEVHVEYVARAGRLWIRRVYTLEKPGAGGDAAAKVVTVDPALIDLPWEAEPNLQGLAVYRKDMANGRWVVTTTGNAALALTKAPDAEPAELSPPPKVGTFEQIDQEVKQELGKVSFVDVVAALVK
jgi:hypothetical protein